MADSKVDNDPIRLDVAQRLVYFIAQHMERESRWLTPEPQVFMNDPHGLLKLIAEEAKLTPETVDMWMVNAQKELGRG